MCSKPQLLVEKLTTIDSITNLLVLGVICTFVLGGFIFINFYRKEHGFVTDIPQTEDPHQVRIDFNKPVFGIAVELNSFLVHLKRLPKKLHI